MARAVTLCPQLVEADISPNGADSRFDPGCENAALCDSRDLIRGRMR